MNTLVAPIIIFSTGVLILGTIYITLRSKSKDDPKIKLLLSFCSYGILLFFVVFLGYVLFFRKQEINNAPFNEFKSLTMEWGFGDSLVNKYNSATGEYQFVDQHDRLVKINVHLPREELIYLHHKAGDLSFWEWPTTIMGDTAERFNGQRPLRYIIQFNYQKLSKKVTFDESFLKDQKLKDEAEQMVTEIKKVLDNDADQQK